jgi:hypothetical protein
MISLASIESLLGSIFFAISLCLAGSITGFWFCRRQGGK